MSSLKAGPPSRAGRERRALVTFLGRRALQPQEAVGFGLKGRDGHRPEPGAAAQAFPALGRIDEGGAGDRTGAIEAFETLDWCDLRAADFARPSVDGRGFVARVDGEPRDPKVRAVFMRP